MTPGVLSNYNSPEVQAIAAVCVALFIAAWVAFARRRSRRRMGAGPAALQAATAQPVGVGAATSRFEPAQPPVVRAVVVPPASQPGTAQPTATLPAAGPPKGARSRFASVKRIALIVFAVGSLLAALGKMYVNGRKMVNGVEEMLGSSQTVLPRCDEQAAATTLQAIFKERTGMSLTRVDNAQQQPGATPDRINCIARFTFSDGSSGNAAYRIERQGQQVAVVFIGETP